MVAKRKVVNNVSLYSLVQDRTIFEIQKAKLIRDRKETETAIRSLGQQIGDLNRRIGMAALEQEGNKAAIRDYQKWINGEKEEDKEE